MWKRERGTTAVRVRVNLSLTVLNSGRRHRVLTGDSHLVSQDLRQEVSLTRYRCARSAYNGHANAHANQGA